MIQGVATAKPAMYWEWIWLAWLLEPGGFVAAFLYCSNPPGRCGDPPDMRVACSLIVTHIAAGIVTLVLSLPSRSYRRTREFWILVAYWAALAAMFTLASFAVTESVARFIGYAAVVIGIAFPVASLSGMITKGLRRRRTMQPADQGPP